jgi:hypothetical protein
MKTSWTVALTLGFSMAAGASAQAADHYCPTSLTVEWGYRQYHQAGFQDKTMTQNRSERFVSAGFSGTVFECYLEPNQLTSSQWDPDSGAISGQPCTYRSFRIVSASNGFQKHIDGVNFVRTTASGNGEGRRCTATVRTPGFPLVVKRTFPAGCRQMGTHPNAFIRCP